MATDSPPTFIIALLGNPNCGKTTLFNDLTGAHQKVGNWPGVTVEKKTGTMTLDGQLVEVIIWVSTSRWPGTFCATKMWIW
jgi:Fe2+ transport system protein B